MQDKIEMLRSITVEYRLKRERISAMFVDSSGPRVLLLHGNSSCKEVFCHVIPGLRDAGYAVLAPDFPGHGGSTDAVDPAATYCFAGYAAVIEELLQVIGWREFLVVGWSLGGHVALELVHQRPDCIGLMLIGAPPGKPSIDALQQAFITDGATLLAGKREFTSEDSISYASQMLGVDPVPDYLLDRVRRTDGRARELMFQSALSGQGIDQREIVKSKARPVAMIHGALEPFVRLDYLKQLEYGSLWRSEIQVVENVGHAPHWQRPEIFSAILNDFLDDATSSL